MPGVFVIHTSADEAFVNDHVLPPLPALGFNRKQAMTPGPAAASVGNVIRRCGAVLAVVPGRVTIEAPLRDLIVAARESGRPVILVPRCMEVLSTADAADSRLPIDAALASLPAADGGIPDTAGAIDDHTLWRSLADLLPSPRTSSPSDRADAGERITWSERAFSTLLADAVARLDYHRSRFLVAEFARHVTAEGKPYPDTPAQRDLGILRKKRQFTLMREYAAAALRTGTTDFNVRRQYAQALIELGEFDTARQVLDQLMADAPKDHKEWPEARGLLGRLHKQLYVNAPAAAGNTANLQQAVEVYGEVFHKAARHTWHGINTASLLIRASRDGVSSRERDTPQTLASKVLTALDDRQKDAEALGKAVDVWDIATRVEALVALGELDAADSALDEYLAHPEIDAFEVSSTYRQFDEVLQLGRDPRTRPLLERLWQAVQRHRASGAVASDDEPESRGTIGTRRLLLGVSDPNWARTDIPDLSIHARMGNVLSISGTERTMQALMKDPLVVSVEESRPAAPPDCVRSLPFINIGKQSEFQGTTGPFTEKGDRALVAIIDDGIDVLHGAFLDDAGNSRIVGIWDQGTNGKPPEGFDFGTYYSSEDVAGFVAQRSNPEPAVPSALRNPAGHGTHVASIAAGRSVGTFAGGVAPDARILVVISGGGETIGYSDTHVAALTFIDQTARRLGLPVVVNVSQGMNAGAHDGKSLVEIAFDEFSKGGRTPGRVVVKSAGNERGTRGHAEMQLLRDQLDEFAWTCREEPWRLDRIELWWNSANEYHFRLRAPDGERSDWLTRAEPELKGKLAGVKFRMEFVRHHVDNGDSRLIVELGSRYADTPVGKNWTIEVLGVNVVAEEDALHAWIERRNTPRSEFVSTNANQRMTLSIPGTAASVITVAAVDAAKPIMVGNFSSHGPTRDDRKKPDICAPGVNVDRRAERHARRRVSDERHQHGRPTRRGSRRAGAIEATPWWTGMALRDANRRRVASEHAELQRQVDARAGLRRHRRRGAAECVLSCVRWRGVGREALATEADAPDDPHRFVRRSIAAAGDDEGQLFRTTGSVLQIRKMRRREARAVWLVVGHNPCPLTVDRLVERAHVGLGPVARQRIHEEPGVDPYEQTVSAPLAEIGVHAPRRCRLQPARSRERERVAHANFTPLLTVAHDSPDNH